MPCDYKNYPANWKSEIRPDILKRANDCCEHPNCLAKNGRLIWRNPKDLEMFEYWPDGMESETWSIDGRKATKVVLTVAHLDHDTNNNDYSNLKALCQLHHLRHDIQQHKKIQEQLSKRKKGLQSLFTITNH